MADALWIMIGLAAVSVAGFVALSRYRLQRRVATSAAATVATGEDPHREYHLPSTIEAAEREMAMLLGRMRAYLRDPYDYAASRIIGEAAFETCLDRAGILGARIAELTGVAAVGPSEHERARGLILESLMVGYRIADRNGGGVATRQGMHPPGRGMRSRSTFRLK